MMICNGGGAVTPNYPCMFCHAHCLIFFRYKVAAVDSEMAKLGEEREHNLSELNQKRVQHVTTLQQMGKIS